MPPIFKAPFPPPMHYFHGIHGGGCIATKSCISWVVVGIGDTIMVVPSVPSFSVPKTAFSSHSFHREQLPFQTPPLECACDRLPIHIERFRQPERADPFTPLLISPCNFRLG